MLVGCGYRGGTAAWLWLDTIIGMDWSDGFSHTLVISGSNGLVYGFFAECTASDAQCDEEVPVVEQHFGRLMGGLCCMCNDGKLLGHSNSIYHCRTEFQKQRSWSTMDQIRIHLMLQATVSPCNLLYVVFTTINYFLVFSRRRSRYVNVSTNPSKIIVEVVSKSRAMILRRAKVSAEVSRSRNRKSIRRFSNLLDSGAD